MSSVNIEKLKEIVGEDNVLHNRADLYVYGSDSSVHEAMPHAIVRPENIGAGPGSSCAMPIAKRSR